MKNKNHKMAGFYFLLFFLLPFTILAAPFSDDFTKDSTSDYQLTHTWQQGGSGSLVYDEEGEMLRVVTGDDTALMFSHVLLPQLAYGVFSFDFMPTDKYPNGGIIKIRLIQDLNNYYEIMNSDGCGIFGVKKIINGQVVEHTFFYSEYKQNRNYNISINFSSELTNIYAFGQEIFINTNTDSIIVSRFEIEMIQQDGYFDNIEYFEPAIDIETPVWDDTIGVCSVTDNATDGSLIVEFGSATDNIDNSDIKYNIYYAPSSLWNNGNWTDNSSVLNAQVNSGTGGCTCSYLLSGLQTNTEYTAGVRVCDKSGNEDQNRVALSAIPTVETFFLDNFSDGNADGWSIIDDSDWHNPVWEVIGGEYCQIVDIKGFQESYHLGSYAYYESGTDLDDYEVSVKVIPNFIEENSRDTIGIMFRYIDNDNYYRFSMSRFQGFSRLEKKAEGEFSTLAVNGRGFEKDEEQTVTIKVDGAKIFVYVNQVPLFAVIDNSHYKGTIALYSLSKAKFDDVKISALDMQPEVIISQPASFSIPVTAFEQVTDQLEVSAVVRNLPVGGRVELVLDGDVSNTIYKESFLTDFFNVLSGYHDIEAVLFDRFDNMLYSIFAKDTNENIGMAGDIFVAIGDSITQGLGDDFESDDLSVNGTNISRGFTPVLTDHLSSCLNNPVTVINEGIGGTFSYDGAYRLASTIQRHTKALYWLIAFGTNDARAPISLPSGVLCIEDDCGDTFKEYMRSMIIELQDAGKIPVLALVPFSLDMTVAEDLLVQEYNQVISDLIDENNLIAEAPNFYTYFKNNTDELFDGLHPNGQGYIKMADMWFDVLTDPDPVTGIIDCN